METTDIIWVFPALLIYMVWKKFRFSDVEFAIIAFVFLCILTILKGSSAIKESFEDTDTTDRSLQTLLELPGYIKTKIGGAMDALIQSVQKSSQQTNDDVVSKETVTDDADVAKNGTVDVAKFAQLKREYVNIGLLLTSVKETNLPTYESVFGASTVDTSQN